MKRRTKKDVIATLSADELAEHRRRRGLYETARVAFLAAAAYLDANTAELTALHELPATWNLDLDTGDVTVVAEETPVG